MNKANELVVNIRFVVLELLSLLLLSFVAFAIVVVNNI
jgi:hypothetical protein